MFGKDDCTVGGRARSRESPQAVRAFCSTKAWAAARAFGSAVLRALVQSSLVLCVCVFVCMLCKSGNTSSTRPSCPRSRTSAEARLHGLCPAKIAHGMIMHRVSHKPGQPKQCGGCSAETAFQVRE